MKLDRLQKIKGNAKPAKRVGRGIGSGKGGHTTGSGHKGQKSRSGSSLPFGFEGGQVPIFKKLPQIGGFKNPTKKDIFGLGVSRLNKFDNNTEVTPALLLETGVISKMPKYGVKLLNTGKLEKKLTLSGFRMSKGAKKALEAAGCTIKE